LLRLRLITAIVLLAILLPLLFLPDPRPFIAFGLLFISAGVWEWGRMNGIGNFKSALMGLAFGVLLLGTWTQFGLVPPPAVWFLAPVVWGLLVPVLLKKGIGVWVDVPLVLRVAVGLVVLALAWLAMAHARYVGINYLFSVLALVWVADVAAYFGGKAFGSHKLAPSVSPGKSWEGAIAGWIGVMVLALTWIWGDSHFSPHSLSFYSVLFDRHPVLSWILFSGLAVASVLGDLVESLVKRSAGFKDSSNLLPGHGGVLDRIDALLPVLPLAVLFFSV